MMLFLISAALAFLHACEPNKRYAVLSLFFDGVPRPGSNEELTGKDTGESKSAREKKTFYQHGPYAARICDGCHEPRTNKLVLPKEELCVFCHVLSAKNTRVHGPLAAGGCTVCHDPHGTFNRALLVADARDFCLFCHELSDIMKRPAHQNTSRSCTDCHDAHGADNEYLLKNRLLSRENGSLGQSL